MQATPGRPDRDRPNKDRLDRPRLRQDLFAEVIDEQGGRFIDVMAPDGANSFRFYEVEYSLACAMDGERDVAGIVKWAQDELGLTPSAQETRSVIAQLGELGFIEPAEAAAPSAVPPPIDDEPELSATVVIPQPTAAAASSGLDVELGAAGTTAPKAEPTRPAPEIALGAPGAAPARRPPEPPAPDIGLGAPGARPGLRTPPSGMPAVPAARKAEDVSLDLADQFAVRPDDVKEAVRASRVMSAVEAPKDLVPPPGRLPQDLRPTEKAGPLPRPQDLRPTEKGGPLSRPPEAVPTARPPELTPAPRAESRPPEPRAESRPPEAVPTARPPEPTPRPSSPTSRPPDVARPPDLSLPRQDVSRQSRPEIPRPTGKPPVELPGAPGQAPATAQVQSAAGSKLSTALIIVLVLAVLAAAAMFVWRYMLAGPSAPADTSAATPPPVKPPPPPPAPPPPPTAKIAMETPPADEIKTGRAGIVETIVADQTAVKEGDPVVKLVGDKPIDAEIAALERDKKKLIDQVAAANKQLDALHTAGKPGEAKAQADLATKQGQLAAKEAALTAKHTELSKFVLTAPAAGTFSPKAKTSQKIALDDQVGSLQREATPVALFKVPDAKAFAVNSSVEVTAGSQHLTCTVADVQATGAVKVACPADPALADGTEVTLKLPTPEPPLPTNAPAPAATGSAATGSAATGSADTVPAGSATGSAAAAPAAGSAEPAAAGSASGSN